MGKFGWSLPPGCGTLPGEEEYPCELCGGDPELPDDAEGRCICPECPVCGAYGDPDCYGDNGHGLQTTNEQAEQLAKMEEAWAEDDRLQAEAMGDIEHMSLEDGIL